MSEAKSRRAEEWEALEWYMNLPGDPADPGMYLSLFHGRHDPNVGMEGWGFDGPIIGPLLWLHSTYGQHLSYETRDERVRSDGPSEVLEPRMDGLLALHTPDGTKYFGDYSVFYHKGGGL